MSGSTCASDNYHYTALFTVGSESKLVLNNVSAETDERVVKASSCGEVIVSGGTYNITGINAFLGAAFETKTASFTDMKLTAKYGGACRLEAMQHWKIARSKLQISELEMART